MPVLCAEPQMEAFRSSTGNLAFDGDDRFVLRTTDQTLWFDVGGNGGTGPVLIADFQEGASTVTLTGSDLVLF